MNVFIHSFLCPTKTKRGGGEIRAMLLEIDSQLNCLRWDLFPSEFLVTRPRSAKKFFFSADQRAA